MPEKTLDMQAMKTGTVRSRYASRWWLRAGKCEVNTREGWIGGAELYVPWWAWPFELLYRAVFGNPAAIMK
jgi:hypothetical protein